MTVPRIPPWRWNLWGPWPPEEALPPPMPDEEIRPLAEQLSKQRPWLAPEENWIAAERALRQKPWRPLVIHFSGEKERSGWDWAELLFKVSIPILILALSTAYSIISAGRQETITRELKEREVVTNFIKEIQFLMLDKGLKSSALDSEVRGVARALAIAALSQVESTDRKRLIIRFLLDSGLNNKKGHLFSLREAKLSRVNLSWSDLRGVKLSWSDLRGADLRGADFGGADLSAASLSKANLVESNLRGANLSRARLGLASLSGAYLSGANLTGADLSNALLIGASFRGSNLIAADLSMAHLRGAIFDGADLSGADLSKAYLSLGSLNNADLSVATIVGADLSHADLRGADLRGADFSGTDLVRANLSEANLNAATLSKADLTGAHLIEADLRGADLEDVKWDDQTVWPSRASFEGVKNIPSALKKQLGLEHVRPWEHLRHTPQTDDGRAEGRR